MTRPIDTARLIALAAFAAAIALLFAARWEALAAFSFADPDDVLRLVQVRDLIGGQGWFDVGQARIDPPGGGDMHWSRLIDAPIAALILFARPLVGGHGAELFAVTAWPFALLTGTAILLQRLGRLLESPLLGAATLIVFALAPLSLMQFAPTRIDHHGAQALLALAALGALLGLRDWRGGALAGLALAAHANISIEALPYMLLFGGVLALDWLRAGRSDHAAGQRLASYVATLALAGTALLAATHGGRVLFGSYCDALSAPYAAALLVAAPGVAVAVMLGSRLGWPMRLLLLALAGAAALAALGLVAPKCLGGPFEALPPRVAELWYANVREGVPVWRQDRDLMLASVLPSLVGLAGLLLGWRRSDGEARHRWARLLLIAGGAVLLSLMLMRAVYVAHLFVAPGIALLFLAAWRRARALASPALRILATVATLLVLPAPLAAAALALGKIGSAGAAAPVKGAGLSEQCPDARSLAPLAALPAQTIFAPLDIGPDILLATPHSVIATGHHRNAAAMDRVINAYLADPATALRLIRETPATLIVLCPRLPEIDVYRKRAPQGLAARLVGGRAPDWAEPLPQPKGSQIKAWRIRS